MRRGRGGSEKREVGGRREDEWGGGASEKGEGVWGGRDIGEDNGPRVQDVRDLLTNSK